jgi:4-aminobutyrate aminotransferase
MASCNIGHRHPKVVTAAKDQIDKLVQGPIGVVNYESLLRLANDLGRVTPGSLQAFFFGNSGAEAVEGAIKLARYVTGRPGIVAFLGGFHGRTYGAASVTSSKSKYRKHYEPHLPSIYFVPFPYCFRCPTGSNPDSCGLSCLDAIQTLFDTRVCPADVACFIVEPIQGEGGYVLPPEGWLRELRRVCSEHNIILIFDEVQTGFGRTGSWFAAQSFRVTPDIMAVAKGIASGFPLGAVCASSALMEQWPAGAFGTTFGGNPVSCAAALATIQVIREESLLDRCRELGRYSLARLEALRERAAYVGDVRGKGLMIGIEFVYPGPDRLPNPEEARRVLGACLDRGLLLYPCGLYDQVIRFIPPLTVGEDELDEGLKIFEQAVLGRT